MKRAIPQVYLSHIGWGIAFITLLGAFIGLWHAQDTLKQQLADSQTELNENKLKSDCVPRDTWTKNTTRVFTITSSGWERSYRIHLPSEFVSDKKYPVLLAFAGKGEKAKEFQLTRGLDTLPVITIYPQATIGTDGTTAWEGAPYSSGADDVAFVNDILDRVEGQLCVQRSHIYSVGWSNGGNLSWLLSCRSSDRIAAFAMVSGAFYYPEQDCHSKRAAAIINIHGDKDKRVPYDGSLNRKLPDINTWVADRAKNNQCATTPVSIQPDLFTQVTTWDHCANDATVRNIRLVGGGHNWPNEMTVQTLGQHTSLQKTPDILWGFLSQHVLH